MKASTKYLSFLNKKYPKVRFRTKIHLQNYGKLREIEGAIVFADDFRDKKALEEQLAINYKKFTNRP